MKGIEADAHEHSEHECLPIPDVYFQVYQETNLNFPQYSFAIAVQTAQAMLSDPRFDPVAFVDTELSDAQMRVHRQTMSYAHAKKSIPIASAEHAERVQESIVERHGHFDLNMMIVPDERLQNNWKVNAYHALGMIGALAGIRDQAGGFKYYRPATYDNFRALAQDVKDRFTDPRIRYEIQKAFDSFSQTLKSKWGTEIAQRQRDAADMSKQGLDPRSPVRHEGGVRRRITPLQEELCDRMIKEYKLMRGGTAVEPPLLKPEEVERFRQVFVH